MSDTIPCTVCVCVCISEWVNRLHFSLLSGLSFRFPSEWTVFEIRSESMGPQNSYVSWWQSSFIVLLWAHGWSYQRKLRSHTHKNKNHRLLATYTMLCTWVRHDTTCPSYCVGKQYINSKHLCFDMKYKQQFPKQLQKFYFLKRFLKLCFMKCHCVFTNLFYIMFC